MNLDENAGIWFVGDAYDLDVRGAVNAGWNAVWMNRRKRKLSEDEKEAAMNRGRVVCVETEEELERFVRGIPGADKMK